MKDLPRELHQFAALIAAAEADNLPISRPLDVLVQGAPVRTWDPAKNIRDLLATVRNDPSSMQTIIRLLNGFHTALAAPGSQL